MHKNDVDLLTRYRTSEAEIITAFGGAGLLWRVLRHNSGYNLFEFKINDNKRHILIILVYLN